MEVTSGVEVGEEELIALGVIIIGEVASRIGFDITRIEAGGFNAPKLILTKFGVRIDTAKKLIKTSFLSDVIDAFTYCLGFRVLASTQLSRDREIVEYLLR